MIYVFEETVELLPLKNYNMFKVLMWRGERVEPKRLDDVPAAAVHSQFNVSSSVSLTQSSWSDDDDDDGLLIIISSLLSRYQHRMPAPRGSAAPRCRLAEMCPP